MSNVIRKTVNFYEDDWKRIEQFGKQHPKNFRSDAAIFRYIITNFFNQYDSDAKKDFVIHWIYPIIIGAIATFGTVSTQNLISLLYDQGFYFHELYVLNGVFVVLGAFSIGFFMANIYWYYKKKSNIG